MNNNYPATDHSAKADDFDAWAHALSTSCGAFHPVKPRDFDRHAFTGKVTPLSASGSLSTSYITTNCPHVYRKRKDVNVDDQSFFYLVLQQRGQARMCQGGEEADMACGDLVLLDASQPSDFYHRGLSQQLSIILPRHVVEDVFRHKPVRSGQRIPGDLQVSRMISLLATSTLPLETQDREEELAFLEALASLLKPVACVTRLDEVPPHNHHLLRKAMAFIEATLDQGQVSADRVAREINVSVRTLHRLFAQAGTSLSRYVIDRRLERCAISLAESRDNRPISLIADRAGFADISHFSRAFKQKYGVSPRLWRQQKLGDGSD
ncbi:MAG: transcriptional regulator FeaR [Ectopseudomonas guguanensis]|uniref:transcriptional regulator FeaR n=1 Tax=Ectopseudomonas guguanensis TaxID=1198456 RepID=UPI00391B5A93